VGKFVYPRGSAHLLHFMELQPFIVDNALDCTHLFSLRALRARRWGTGSHDDSLVRFLERTAIKPVAELALDLLQAGNGNGGKMVVAECHPGLGLTFEYLKLLVETAAGAAQVQARKDLLYQACGPEELKLKFEVLHSQDLYPIHYYHDGAGEPQRWLLAANAAQIAIYNHNQSLVQPEEPALKLADFLEQVQAPALIAVRLAKAEEEQWRTTVRGRSLKLPVLKQVLAQCRKNNPFWHYRVTTDHDSDFFLPCSGGQTELLLAYTLGRPLALPGYQAVGEFLG
jgi:hypothetical protein